jgi:hypothetical protein
MSVLDQAAGRILTKNTIMLGVPPNFQYVYRSEVLRANDLVSERVFPFGDSEIRFGGLARDGKHILVGFSQPKRSSDKWRVGERDGVRLWGESGDEPLRIFIHPSVRGATFDPAGHRVLTWGYDKTVRLWDTQRSDPLGAFELPKFIEAVAFVEDGAKMIVRTEKGSYLYDVGVTPEGSIEDQVNDLTLRSATRIDNSGEVVRLSLAEWRRLMEGGSRHR